MQEQIVQRALFPKTPDKVVEKPTFPIIPIGNLPAIFRERKSVVQDQELASSIRQNAAKAIYISGILLGREYIKEAEKNAQFSQFEEELRAWHASWRRAHIIPTSPNRNKVKEFWESDEQIELENAVVASMSNLMNYVDQTMQEGSPNIPHELRPEYKASTDVLGICNYQISETQGFQLRIYYPLLLTKRDEDAAIAVFPSFPKSAYKPNLVKAGFHLLFVEEVAKGHKVNSNSPTRSFKHVFDKEKFPESSMIIKRSFKRNANSGTYASEYFSSSDVSMPVDNFSLYTRREEDRWDQAIESAQQAADWRKRQFDLPEIREEPILPHIF